MTRRGWFASLIALVAGRKAAPVPIAYPDSAGATTRTGGTVKISIDGFAEPQECRGVLISDDEYRRNCRFVKGDEVWKFFDPETGRVAISGFYWAVPLTTTEEWARKYAAKEAAHAADLRRICGEAPYETYSPLPHK